MNVFINCPFDKKYLTLLRYMLFTLKYMKVNPYIALSDGDCGKKRIDKIQKMIEDSEISIHDISRMKSESKDEYYRLNMPFELGIDYGIERLQKKGKKYLILEGEKYTYQKALSDYSGFDVFAHQNDPDTLVKIIRDWFVNNIDGFEDVQGANKIYLDYFDCWAYIFDELIKKGYSKKQTEEIPIKEYLGLVNKWCTKNV
jgi:hypothetical protein